MSTVLVTGFGPYGHTPLNPAQTVVEALANARIDGIQIVTRIVPNNFFKSIEFVAEAISQEQPEIVVMLGEYPGRAMITVERLAQNLNDATRYQLADNAGFSPLDELTAEGGPVAYYATLPIRAMVKSLREAGIPADISDAPGTLVCNHLMYGVLHHIASHSLPIRAGWIHLPQLPEIAARVENLGTPSMSTETSAAGVITAIRAILAHPTDIHEPIVSRFQI